MDMLSGGLLGKILLFALPLAASSMLQQLFNSVDVAVVGHFAADPAAATAAVGSNGAVINLIINLFVGLSVGANVVISGYIGSGNREKAEAAVHTSISVALISGVLLIFLGFIITKPLLEVMNTPEAVLPLAVQYLRIYFLGMPFIMLYNFGASILRCIGDTKRPLICLVISGVLNAGLNLFLVIVFHLDVAGVAIATVVSNAVSSVLVISFLIRERSEVHLDLRKLRIVKPDLLRIMRIGIPAGLQNMVFSVSNVIIQSVLNGFGTMAVAGSAVALNFENFSYFIIAAFNQAAVTFTSQNYAARQYDRCRSVFRLCMTLSMILTACMSWTFILARPFFTSFFTSDPDVMRYAELRMLCVLTFNFLTTTYDVGGAAMRGLGYSATPAVLTIFGTCLLRLVWAYTICRAFPRFEILMIVYPISWIVTGSAVLAAYFIMRRKAFSLNTSSH